ncbi:MAG: GTP 3',8-cyclase MoaA [Pseudomonadota bacterium]
MIDPFGREITYLRLSVTDRCDLRCVYCMAERMTFLPKAEVLSLEELDAAASAFVSKGVKKIRLTGGEPLVRRDIMALVRRLSRHLETGALNELTLTTNGTLLPRYAADLASAGVKRVNVSVDTLDAERFEKLTRGGRLEAALEGVDAALAAGLSVKINAVAMKSVNIDDIPSMMAWAHGKGMDLTLIEAMPMGEIDEDRFDQYASLWDVRRNLEKDFSLRPLAKRTGGPARYFHVTETGGTLGLITPLSGNFCEGCNRVRLTCTGKLFMCLGQDDAADLRAVMRSHPDDPDKLGVAIDEAIGRKPKSHDFEIDAPGAGPSVKRHMSVTGG